MFHLKHDLFVPYPGTMVPPSPHAGVPIVFVHSQSFLQVAVCTHLFCEPPLNKREDVTFISCVIIIFQGKCKEQRFLLYRYSCVGEKMRLARATFT